MFTKKFLGLLIGIIAMFPCLSQARNIEPGFYNISAFNETASNPTAPLPAKSSKKLIRLKSCPKISKMALRTKLGVGRMPLGM